MPSETAMRVCHGCGAIAPTGRATCKLCDAAFDVVDHTEVRPDGVMFAAVAACDFVCRACGLRSTLDGLYLSPEVTCTRCGVNQVFLTSQWKDALAHAHDVADLSGPPPAGQGSLRHQVPLAADNPFASLGVANTAAELEERTTTIRPGAVENETLRVNIATGHPVCAQGHGPLKITIGEAGRVESSCATCVESSAYLLPPEVNAINAACCGVLDDDHRVGKVEARVRAATSGGPIALLCPNCSAALAPTEGATMAACGFCGTVAYLPRDARVRTSAVPKARPFWLLFRGPSGRRLGKTIGTLAPSPTAAEPPSPAPAPTTETQDQPIPPRRGADPRQLAMIFATVLTVFVLVATVIFAVAASKSPSPGHRRGAPGAAKSH